MSAQPCKRLVVLGSGSWGTALAIYGASRFEQVVLWGPFAEEIDAINRDRANEKYIPGVKIPENIIGTTDLAEALSQDCVLLACVPSHVFTLTLEQIIPFKTQIQALLIATKGVTDEGLFLHEIARQKIPNLPVVLLSGPSFAKEVATGLPTAVTFASDDEQALHRLQALFHSPIFRVYPSDDLPGVAIGAVVKNVLAIAVGVSEGLGYGANARAALITGGLHEMKQLSLARGGQVKTVLSLAALGDMILTTTDNQSRNRRFGLALGQGKDIAQAEKDIGQVVEGKTNVKQLMAMAKEFDISMPICQAVYEVLYENKAAKQAMLDLLNLPMIQ